MTVLYDIAELCELLAEPTRVAMVLALMDGSTRPAGELARAAGVSAQTASSHLGKLLSGGVLSVEQQGRHRYYRVAHEGVAQAVEALGVVRPARPPRLLLAPQRPLEVARTCYRHLAGKLGVALRERLEALGFIVVRGDAYELCPLGVKRLAGLLPEEVLGAREALAGKRCLDWTERQFHVGGALGNALMAALFSKDWVRRVEGRGLRVTSAGERGLRALLGLDAAALGSGTRQASSASAGRDVVGHG
ncbi:MAG TPA: metalloregulator ArsR/SmtB family transcription factor [Polyangiaceae bacterium]|nr:metalloregulator ArsR/SmtB family transcription factor [Polyangiaceae bacterium]